MSRISDGANARALYKYVGPSRLSEKTLLNGASTVSTLKMTYDGIAQITSALYRNSGDTATIIGYEHGYDKLDHPEYEIRTHQSSEGDAYMYDNLYRVTRTIYDDSDPTSPTYASARTDDWLMDDIGNRTKIYAKSATPTEYEHNAVNEYTSVGGTGFEYDAAGNLTKDDTHYYFWDYMNRLTKVELVADSSDVAAYTYDANNRRVEKIVYTADPDETTQYFYAGLPSEASAKAGWSCIEEREDDGTLLATYINGPRIDEYILMNRDSTDYWYMQSPIVGNVAALVNSSGEIQEGYKYRAYGEATVLTGAGNGSTWFTSDDDTATVSAVGNLYTFTGRRLDDETMLMYFRNRMYWPDLGIFGSHDPMGYVDGMSLYLGYFVPWTTDPTGMKKKECGMDATGILSQMRASVEAQIWNDQTYCIRRKLCKALIVPPAAFVSWDVVEFYDKSKFDTGSVGKPCHGTYEISGKCYNNGAVNYYTYGVLSRICHDYFKAREAHRASLPWWQQSVPAGELTSAQFSEAPTLNRVHAYKAVWMSAIRQQAVEFARAGHRGVLVIGDTPNDAVLSRCPRKKPAVCLPSAHLSWAYKWRANLTDKNKPPVLRHDAFTAVIHSNFLGHD